MKITINATLEYPKSHILANRAGLTSINEFSNFKSRSHCAMMTMNREKADCTFQFQKANNTAISHFSHDPQIIKKSQMNVKGRLYFSFPYLSV